MGPSKTGIPLSAVVFSSSVALGLEGIWCCYQIASTALELFICTFLQIELSIYHTT